MKKATVSFFQEDTENNDISKSFFKTTRILSTKRGTEHLFVIEFKFFKMNSHFLYNFKVKIQWKHFLVIQGAPQMER